MNISFALRLACTTLSIAMTNFIFSAVISNAEETQPDGSIRLAHTVGGLPQGAMAILIAQVQAQTTLVR